MEIGKSAKFLVKDSVFWSVRHSASSSVCLSVLRSVVNLFDTIRL